VGPEQRKMWCPEPGHTFQLFAYIRQKLRTWLVFPLAKERDGAAEIGVWVVGIASHPVGIVAHVSGVEPLPLVIDERKAGPVFAAAGGREIHQATAGMQS